MVGNRAMQGVIVIEGKFPLEELNKIIEICDYIGRFYKNLEAKCKEGN